MHMRANLARVTQVLPSKDTSEFEQCITCIERLDFVAS